MTAPKETTPKETTPPTQGQPSTEDTSKSGLTAGVLRGWIKEEIGNLLPGKSTQDSGGQQPGTTQPSADLKGEVAAALQQLKAREDRQKRDERVDKMLEKFEAPVDETPPVERRKVEKFMRWGD